MPHQAQDTEEQIKLGFNLAVLSLFAFFFSSSPPPPRPKPPAPRTLQLLTDLILMFRFPRHTKVTVTMCCTHTAKGKCLREMLGSKE